MKSLTFIGLILLAIGLSLFYINNTAFDLRVFYGALSGIGIGLIIGGLVGYISKGRAMKEAKLKQEFRQLKKSQQGSPTSGNSTSEDTTAPHI